MLTLPLLGDFNSGVLGQAALFFFVSLGALTVLGSGLALMLPARLSNFAWAIAPYLGWSLLVTAAGLVVAVGGTVQLALVLSAVVAAVLVAIQVRRHRVPSPASLAPVLLLSIASYGVAALAMARQGTLGYVGPAFDPYVWIRSAEWLKYHPEPLFSPTWYSTVPPYDGWSAPGAAVMDAVGDVYWLLERGARFWEAAIGIILGWDSALVFRPAQAVLLSLAAPATYLFARTLLGAGSRVALSAAVLVGLNSTNLFWISVGHPGQASWIAMLPVALILALVFLEEGALLPAAISVAGLLSGYYQAAAFLAVIAGPVVVWRVVRSDDRGKCLLRAGALTSVAALLSLPLQVIAGMMITRGMLHSTVGWGNPGFPSPGEALGTVPSVGGIELAGSGEWAQLLSQLLPGRAIDVATIAGFSLAALGLVAARRGSSVLRPFALGLVLVLAGLYFGGYPYGYVKAQSIAAFLVATAAAAGAGTFSKRRRTLQASAVLALSVVVAVAGANFAAVEGAFWQPSGNVWKTSTWDGADLAGILPPNASTRLSPFLQASDETVAMTGYFLRQQKLVGAYALEGWDGTQILPQAQAARHADPEIEVLDRREIPAFRGFLPTDVIWSGRLGAVYRHPSSERANVALSGQDGRPAVLPAELPVTVRVSPAAVGKSGSLLATFSVQEGNAEVLVSWNGERRTIAMSPGLAVRLLPIGSEGTSLSLKSGRAVLLAVIYRPEAPDPTFAQDFPRSVAVVINSRLDNGLVVRLAHLDAGIIGGASVEVSPAAKSGRIGWFHLPTLEDGFLRQMQLDLDPVTLEHRLVSNGEEQKIQVVSPARDRKRLTDGEYIAYFTPLADPSLRVPRRIPLYRYRLDHSTVSDFEQFPISLAWTDPPTGE